jgi:hypothetical protein
MLSVIDVKDEWIWNKLANIIIAVKWTLKLNGLRKYLKSK